MATRALRGGREDESPYSAMTEAKAKQQTDVLQESLATAGLQVRREERGL